MVWQLDDYATRDAADCMRSTRLECRTIHNPIKGIVPSENLALEAATGDILFLIDDDATAPQDWIERHLSQYGDGSIGAVGGPADNYESSGARFPIHPAEPIGKLTWYGSLIGNMYDQPTEWRSRGIREVDHLVGYNMSIRRASFGRFEERLKPYWHMFEADVCLQVKASGYRVLFDFDNVVRHYPTNTVYRAGRTGNLQLKVYNNAYNWAFVMAKHSSLPLRAPRVCYMFLVGKSSSPGFVSALAVGLKTRSIRSEAGILRRTWKSYLEGWRAGTSARFSTIGTPVESHSAATNHDESISFG